MKLKLTLIVLLTIICNQLAFAEFSIEEATIASVHHAIQAKQLTCEALVEKYLDRIKKYNLSVSGNKPPFNAIAEINPAVIEEAKKLDADYAKSQQMPGSLFCIPVLLKDNIDSIEGTASSGSLVLLDNHPNKDAFLVARLRQSGAIILGKGSMDEFASGITGISGRSGRIGNAYDRSKNSGGSSGGPGVAVSANFAMVSVGTDNSGSVRFPAAFNGIVGLRPSTGLISQSGIFPRGNIDGTAGPLARTVEDLAALLDVIAKQDSNDPKTISLPRPTSYAAYLKVNGLQGKRIGIIRSVGKANPYRNMPLDAKQAIDQSIQTMQSLGAVVVDNIVLPDYQLERKYNEAGELQDVNDYLAAGTSTVKNYRDICLSDKTRTFGTVKNCLKFIKHLPPKDSKGFQEALAIQSHNQAYLENVMKEHHLDALFIPVSPHGSATYDPKSFGNEVVASNAGVPGITFPVGYTKKEGMPIGIELIGKKYNEGTLIELAYAYEKNNKPRLIPPMPFANNTLSHYSISQMNDLFTRIGEASYQEILSKGDPKQFYLKLSPAVFREVVVEQLGKTRYNSP